MCASPLDTITLLRTYSLSNAPTASHWRALKNSMHNDFLLDDPLFSGFYPGNRTLRDCVYQQSFTWRPLPAALLTGSVCGSIILGAISHFRNIYYTVDRLFELFGGHGSHALHNNCIVDDRTTEDCSGICRTYETYFCFQQGYTLLPYRQVALFLSHVSRIRQPALCASSKCLRRNIDSEVHGEQCEDDDTKMISRLFCILVKQS